LLIALGVYAAVVVTARRYRARGGDPELITATAVWAVPAGIIGARLYHVVTDFELYRHNLAGAFKIWDGGLGIWGGILLGTAVGAWVARRRGADVALLMDCVAPALPLAQAIGRLGNYFNQELYGRPTTLPWGLRIDPAHWPVGHTFRPGTTFHPTFLYELLWDLAVVGLVLATERRVRLRRGALFAVYVAAYTFGRFWIESLRIDYAHKFLGLRLNDWTSIVVFVLAATYLFLRGRRPPDTDGVPAGAAGQPGIEPAPDDQAVSG
jgi:prolipoprotein diacylglyceryl transferase